MASALGRRGQFYILSMIIIALGLSTIAFGLMRYPRSAARPASGNLGFILNNLESEAQNAHRIGVSNGNLESTFAGYAKFTEREMAEEMISLSWNYEVSGSRLTYTITLKSEDTIIKDTVTLD